MFTQVPITSDELCFFFKDTKNLPKLVSKKPSLAGLVAYSGTGEAAIDTLEQGMVGTPR